MWILRFYYFITLCVVFNQCIDISSLGDITEPTCSDKNCENVTQISTSEIYTQNSEITESSHSPGNDAEDETTESFKLFTLKPQKPLLPVVPRKPNNTESNIPTAKKPTLKIEKTKSEICECDSKTSSCDINCCCDLDCTDHQIQVFSFCSNIHEKIYDSRYCYSKNFIYHNTSKFILEKLADNLFCIAYDNLPPVYTVNNNVSIQNERDLVRAIDEIGPNDFKWNIEPVRMDPRFQTKEPYRHGDTVWKFEKNLIEPLELLQTGFTGHCSLKKPVKFLEGWKGSCFQTNLSNSNSYLFAERYNNFTIIKSPLLIDLNKFNRYQKCSENLCAPIETNFCIDSWTSCNKNKTNPTSCSSEKCENIIKSVRYEIRHNGTMGITDIKVYFKEANVSEKFYQKFEILYEWVNDNKGKSFKRSGNPGYTVGNPIFVGTLVTNKSYNIETKNIIFNKTRNYLTLPISKVGGECNELEKYIVKFGENVKLTCKLKFKTKYFSSSTCLELQNKTLELLLTKSFLNFSEINSNKMQISKSGDIFGNSTTNWVEVFFNRVPIKNLVTGRIYGDKIWCSGLITSMRVDIVHSILSKPEFVDNHVILGAGITFANSTDISWPKCKNINCIDNLDVEIVSYVSFHDASKPSRLYFASGPNLDISLPYDFFYPFLSNSDRSNHSFNLVISCLFIMIISYKTN